MVYMVIHNAKIHKAARTEKGHLVRPTLESLSNIRQWGTSLAILQLATSARQCGCRFKCQAAMGQGDFGCVGWENGAPPPSYTKQLVGIHNEAK
ncbi:hypothetical protein HZ326_24249 [Fusarium oxysporum f. sp. albedinis]|nr:hypothetical protein HZ326_24249 [Fusarium oxysporum f. sp. albedinis]